ncbi:unnamed protein product [Phytomonas sp. EM1]|nr:unnamed protein product [Phytomonas sp. EM1]|eukprot:CCW61170.1 unnamed protein product [Phytomonas sp. isolate EM1]
MGACCCFYFGEGPTNLDSPSPRVRYPVHSNLSRFGDASQGLSEISQADQRPRCCQYCGAALDPSLLDGHEESCRVNHKASASRTSAPTPKFIVDDDTDIEDANEDELCVVCFQHRRCYIFLPCGHIACCGECVKRLDACPICRAARNGLCYVPANVISRYYCNSCGNFIAPTLFDGHREACALILRQAKEQHPPFSGSSDLAKLSTSQAGEEAVIHEDARSASSGSLDKKELDVDIELKVEEPKLPPTVHPSKHTSVRCVECAKEDSKLVVCLPCGHRVMCGACAANRSTCSVCLQEIKQTLNAFD